MEARYKKLDKSYSASAGAPATEQKTPYLALSDAPAIEMQPSTPYVALSEAPDLAVHINIHEEKDLDLPGAVKVKLMQSQEYKSLNTPTRTDIMEALQIEMSSLKDIPAKDLSNALRYLILKNPELRTEMEKGDGNDLFTLQTSEYDSYFSSAGGNFLRATAEITNPCSNPFFCLMDANLGAEMCLGASAIAVLCCACWATGRPAVSTCTSRESSTIKTLKLLTPALAALSVALLVYKFCSDSLGAWSSSHDMSPSVGQIGGPLLAGWMMYLLTACPVSANECTEEKKDEEVHVLTEYLHRHPVNAAAQRAVMSSNIEKLLVEYKRAGDHNPTVRRFSRDVLNEWIKLLETVQLEHQMDEQSRRTLTL